MPDEERKIKVTIGPEKYLPVKSGIYRARLIEVKEGIGKYKQPIYLVSFEILDETYEGRMVIGMINQSSNGVNGKLWQLYRALTEDGLDVFDAYYMNDLVGRECFVNVEQRGGYNAITEYIHQKHLRNIKRLNF